MDFARPHRRKCDLASPGKRNETDEGLKRPFSALGIEFTITMFQQGDRHAATCTLEGIAMTNELPVVRRSGCAVQPDTSGSLKNASCPTISFPRGLLACRRRSWQAKRDWWGYCVTLIRPAGA